jgi:hypothetical protein
LISLYISRILNSFRSAAVAFDRAFAAPFLRLNLGVPNDVRYAVALMEIKERGVASIKKKKRMAFIVAEFYMKLGVYNHVRNFLLIKFPFNLEIVIFVLRVRYDSERII